MIKIVDLEFMTALVFPDPDFIDIKTGGTTEALATICSERTRCVETKAQVHFSEVKRKLIRGDYRLRLPDGREVADQFDVRVKAFHGDCL